jgi:SOS-response transcriptional repressor LexA
MEFKDRLQSRMKAQGLTATDLSKATGVSKTTVSFWVNGTNGAKGANLLALAKALSCPPEWLSSGSGSAELEGRTSLPDVEAPDDLERSNVEMTLQPTRSFSYPEISWVQAGSAKEAMDVSNVALCPQHSSDVWAGENAFWLKVMGNSMSSSSGNSFPEGFLILVGPDIEPRPGQFVVARMIDTNEATFKQLVRDAGELYLKPLNSSYPTKPVDNTWEIVGTVVDGKMPKSVFL